MKAYSGFVTAAICLALFSACAKTIPEKSSEQILVTASFYPIAHFAEKVGGNLVEVFDLSGGKDPHQYQPKPRDIIQLKNAKLVLLQGAGLEPWAENLRAQWEREGATELVILDQLPTKESNLDNDHQEHNESEESQDHHDDHAEEAHDADHSHEHGGLDPHTWLDPVLAAKTVELIATALSDVDPENAAVYQRNAETYIADLQILHETMRSGLSDCEKGQIITSHEAFAYLAARYGFETIPIAGFSSEDTPSAQRLAELVRIAADQKLDFVLTEKNVNDSVADTLAREAKLQVLKFETLETRPKNGDYLGEMRNNLSSLKTALECTI